MIIETQQTSFLSVLALALATRCSAQSTSAPVAQTISIGTEEFVVDPNNVILGGTTVSAGGPAVTINSAPVLLDAADDLFVGGKEVLTGHVAKINVTSLASSQNAATTSVRAGSSSSSMSTGNCSSAVPQSQGDLNTGALQAFLDFVQTRSGASESSQGSSLLKSTVRPASSSLSVASPSGFPENPPASSSMSLTAQSTPQSSGIASPSEVSVHENAVISASSSGTSNSSSMTPTFQYILQTQNITTASSTTSIGGLGGQNAGTRTWTSSSFLGNSAAQGSSSLDISSSTPATIALAVSPRSAITVFAPAASSVPTTSSQPDIAAASSSVLIVAGALLSLSSQGKILSDDITLPPTKTLFIESIETIESQVTDLKGLLGRLGGNTIAPPSCHASKSKARFKKRNLWGDLDNILSDVECAAQDLSALKINLQTEPPALDDIGPALDDLGDTASDMEKNDEDDDDTSTDSPSQARTSTDTPSQARTSTESPSQTKTSLGSRTTTSFGSTTRNSVSSSSATLNQTTTGYPCYSGPLYLDPVSTSEDADEVSAFNALLPSLLSSEFSAYHSSFITVAANATSSANATSAVSTTSIPVAGKSILAVPTTHFTATSDSSVQSSPSSRLAPVASPLTTSIIPQSSVQPLLSSIQAPTSAPVVTVAANIVAVLVNPPSRPICSMVLANAGDGCEGVDYCDCSSTYVPPLTSTVIGSVTSGCSYATQPPANDCPVNSIALGIAGAIIDFALASAASYDLPTSAPSIPTLPNSRASSALAPGLEIPQYSNLETPSSFTPPEPTTSPSTPIPSIVSHNNKGSSLCSSLNNGSQSCKAAYSYYNPEYFYLDYTAYVQSDDITAPGSVAIVTPTADRGCSAMLRCAPGADGLYGKQIIAAFDALYSYHDVQICGSIYLANGCWMTANFCNDCEASVPCAALPVEVQPEQGGRWPCYFPNGTVWHG